MNYGPVDLNLKHNQSSSSPDSKEQYVNAGLEMTFKRPSISGYHLIGISEPK